MLTHRNLRANAMQGRAWVPGLDEGDEVFYGVLPLFHAYGMTLCLTFAMSIGARLVLFPKFDVDLVLDAARSTRRRRSCPPCRRSTTSWCVPPSAGTERSREHPLRHLGRDEPADRDRRPVGDASTGGLLVEGYGMTESSPVALGNPMGPTRRPGTVGVPFPSTEIRVVDPEQPERRPPRGRGGRAARPRTAGLPGLLAPTRRDGRDAAARRMAPHRRHRARLRRRVRHDRRPGEGAHHHRRVQRLAVGGRGGAAAPTPTCAAPRSSACRATRAARTSPRRWSSATGAVFDEAALRDFCRASLTPYKVPRRIEPSTSCRAR